MEMETGLDWMAGKWKGERENTDRQGRRGKSFYIYSMIDGYNED